MITRNNNQRQSGGTLIETMIYTLIVSGVISAFMLIIYSTVNISEKIQASINLVEEKMFIGEKLDWILQSANAVTVPADGATAATLTLTKLNFAANPLVVDVAGGALRLKTGAESAIALTRADTTVTNPVFEQKTVAGRGRIKATMTIANGSGSMNISQIIYLK